MSEEQKTQNVSDLAYHLGLAYLNRLVELADETGRSLNDLYDLARQAYESAEKATPDPDYTVGDFIEDGMEEVPGWSSSMGFLDEMDKYNDSTFADG
jgi:hypothetical protein